MNTKVWVLIRYCNIQRDLHTDADVVGVYRNLEDAEQALQDTKQKAQTIEWIFDKSFDDTREIEMDTSRYYSVVNQETTDEYSIYIQEKELL